MAIILTGVFMLLQKNTADIKILLYFKAGFDDFFIWFVDQESVALTWLDTVF